MKFSEFIALDVSRVPAQQLALVHATLEEEKTPETWIEMAELGYMIARNAGALKAIPDQALANACVAQVFQIMSVMGGRQVYVSNKPSR